jgi:hypothetical protein
MGAFGLFEHLVLAAFEVPHGDDHGDASDCQQADAER